MIYQRVKVPNKGWRYQRVKTGRGIKTGDLQPPFYKLAVVGTRANGRPDQQWLRLEGNSYNEAVKSAETVRDVLAASAKGLTVAEADDVINANRTPIKIAVEKFLSETSKSKTKKTLAAYTRNLNHFVESLGGKVRFVDEVDADTIRAFRDFLAKHSFSEKTQHNRVVTVLSLLKKNGIKTDFKLADDLPAVDEEPAIPYDNGELKKLFANMDKEQAIRYRFFLGTACRDREVTFAAWNDIDSAKGLYHIRPKKDVGFTIKNHESRTVRMPTELVRMLKERKNHAPHTRWIFVNEIGQPDNHFLRKLKRIALHAGLNCGQCRTTVTKGKYENKREVEVSCKTDPVCEHWYLHRFRKTYATRWLANGIPVRTIQYLLGHKSLETTMRHLGIGNIEEMGARFDAAFSD
jgi:integrase/recombinase XerD